VLAVIIALSIPSGLLLAGLNISFKLPDIYGFDLSRTAAANELQYAGMNEEIATIMSDYLRHKTDSFTLNTEKDGETVSVFTDNDAKSMKKYRDALDVSATAMFVLLPISVFGYLIIFLLRRKAALKYSIRAAFIVYFGSAASVASVMLSKVGAASFAADIIGVSTERNDILPQMFGWGFFAEMFAVAIGISLIAMFFIFALTARLLRNSPL
jgi:hypothetical protein